MAIRWTLVVLLFCLSSTTQADNVDASEGLRDGTYEIRIEGPLPQFKGEHSCGSMDRLLRGDYDLQITADRYRLGGHRWQRYERHSTFLWLHRGWPSDRVWYQVWFILWEDGTLYGVYTLYGTVWNDLGRVRCEDSIEIKGRKR
jgi:hypothetical protein